MVCKYISISRIFMLFFLLFFMNNRMVIKVETFSGCLGKLKEVNTLLDAQWFPVRHIYYMYYFLLKFQEKNYLKWSYMILSFQLDQFKANRVFF